jgi:hypothetical protein
VYVAGVPAGVNIDEHVVVKPGDSWFSPKNI